ncbi:MAG: tetratricopeptide repeat protein [bacterium]
MFIKIWLVICAVSSFLSYNIPNHFDLKYKTEKAASLFEHSEYNASIEQYTDLQSFIKQYFELNRKEKNKVIVEEKMEKKLIKKIKEYEILKEKNKDKKIYYTSLKNIFEIYKKLVPIYGKEIDFDLKNKLNKKIDNYKAKLKEQQEIINIEEIKKALVLYKEVLSYKHKWIIAEKYDSNLEHKVKEKMAACYRELKEYDKAEAIYKDLIQHSNDSELQSNAQFQIGEAYMRQNEHKKAIEQYQIVIKRFPNTRAEKLAYYGIAWSYYKMGQFKEALDGFITLEKVYPNDPDLSPEARYRMFQCMFNLKDYNSIVANYKYFEINPDYSNHRYADDAKLILADSYYTLENFELAIKKYNELYKGQQIKISGKFDYEKDPDLTDKVLIGLSKCYFEKNDLEMAKNFLSEIRKKYSETFILDEVIYLEAKIYYTQGELQKSITSLEEVVSKYPKSYIIDNVYYKLGLVYFELITQDRNNIKKALDNLKKISKESNFYKFAKIKLSEIYREIDINLAINEDKKIIESDVENEIKALAQLDIGEIYYFKEEYDQAKIEFNKILENYKDTRYVYDAQIYIGLVLKELGKLEEAISLYTQILSQQNLDDEVKVKAKFNLGLVYDVANQLDKAFKCFQEITEGELVGQAELQIINLLEKTGKIEDALKKCDEILTRKELGDKTKVRVRYKKGFLYYNQKNYKDAKKEYELCLENEIASNEIGDKIFYQIGQCYFIENDFQDAEKYFEKIIYKYPNSDIIFPSVYNLSLCYQKQKLNDIEKINKLILQAEGEAKAVLLMQKGNLEEDKNLLQQSEKSFNESLTLSQKYNIKARIILSLANVLRKQEKYDVSIKKYQEVINNFSRSDLINDAKYGLAECYRNLITDKDVEYESKALEIYNSLSKVKNYASQSTYKIGSVFLKKRNINEAVQYFKKVIDNPDVKEKLKACAYFSIGQAFYNYGDYEKSIPVFQSIIEKYSKEKEILENARFFLSESYWNQMKFEEAKKSYEQFINLFPQSKYVFNSLETIAECYEKQNNIIEAVKTYDKILLHFPSHLDAPRIQLKKGNLFFNNKEYELAIQEYNKVISKYNKTKEVEKAKESINDCIEALALKEIEKANKLYKLTVTKTYEKDAGIYFEQTIKAYQKVIEKYPNTLTSINAYLYIASCWENMDQNKKALKIYQDLFCKIEKEEIKIKKDLVSRLLETIKKKAKKISIEQQF